MTRMSKRKYDSTLKKKTFKHIYYHAYVSNNFHILNIFKIQFTIFP